MPKKSSHNLGDWEPKYSDYDGPNDRRKPIRWFRGPHQYGGYVLLATLIAALVILIIVAILNGFTPQ